MAAAYGFALPGYQKTLVTENYVICNKRNIPTRQKTTLATWNVLLFCEYYMQGRTDLCGADMRLTQPLVHRAQHVCLKPAGYQLFAVSCGL